MGTILNNTFPLTDTVIQVDDTGVFCFDESATDLSPKGASDKSLVEPTGDAYIDEFIIPKIICSIEETMEDEKIIKNIGDLLPEDIPSPKRKKSITWSEDLPSELSHLQKAFENDAKVENLSRTKPPVKLEEQPKKSQNVKLSCVDQKRRNSSLSTTSSRKGSYTSDEILRKGSLTSGASSRRSSVFESPSRKSSLTSNISGRKGSVCNTYVRKGSTSSYVSNRNANPASMASSRKSSLSSRKGSATWDAQSKGSNISRETQERINRCLDTSEVNDTSNAKKNNVPLEIPKSKPRPLTTLSRRNSRRNTLVNTPNNVELESLVAANASEPPGDLTLSCILNHIAFVNQTEISAKMGARLKESRKEQVKQVSE